MHGGFLANAISTQDDFTFKSVTISFLLPTGYSRTFENPVLFPILSVYYNATSYLGPIGAIIDDPNAPPPPAVPEPAMIALTSAAFGGLLLLRSKRA